MDFEKIRTNFEKIYQQLKKGNINAQINNMSDNIVIMTNKKNVIAAINPDPEDDSKIELIIGDDQGFEGDIAFITTKQDADTLLKTVQIIKPYLN